MRIQSGDIVTTVSADRLRTPFHRATLVFEGLVPPIESLALRVFIDDPIATAQTPTDANPHHLGTLYLYGIGLAPPPSYDPATPSQWSPRDVTLDITKPLTAFKNLAHAQEHPISIVALNAAGTPIEKPAVDLSSISLILSS